MGDLSLKYLDAPNHALMSNLLEFLGRQADRGPMAAGVFPGLYISSCSPTCPCLQDFSSLFSPQPFVCFQKALHCPSPNPTTHHAYHNVSLCQSLLNSPAGILPLSPQVPVQMPHICPTLKFCTFSPAPTRFSHCPSSCWISNTSESLPVFLIC